MLKLKPAFATLEYWRKRQEEAEAEFEDIKAREGHYNWPWAHGRYKGLFESILQYGIREE